MGDEGSALMCINIWLKGDEGSALMCITESGVWELNGVLSTRGQCRDDIRPSLYTSIPGVKHWIQNTIGTI